jgi:hypothetical protein
MLVTAAVAPLMVRDGDQVRTVPAGLSVFGVGEDGKLAFARKYDIEVRGELMFWCGMITRRLLPSARDSLRANATRPLRPSPAQ